MKMTEADIRAHATRHGLPSPLLAAAPSAPSVPETAAEPTPAQKYEQKAEEEIQGEIAKYLRLHELEYVKPDMRKKSPLPPGWPDFTTAYRGVALGLEAKTAAGTLEQDQVNRHALMRPHWRVEVVRGVADVQAIFRDIDKKLDATPSIT